MAVLGAQQLQLGNDCFWPRAVLVDRPLTTQSCRSSAVASAGT